MKTKNQIQDLTCDNHHLFKLKTSSKVLNVPIITFLPFIKHSSICEYRDGEGAILAPLLPWAREKTLR
jgi:hypothetical protein